jgi:mannose-1-phosphate guanylyltransferase/mannose-1-phosphate guanylyltransferase/mannose-6-phosphate isomerase
MTTIHPVILSGGSGTRLWPLSRAALPKQLLPLASEHSLLQDTVSRLADVPEIAAPLMVCNVEHRFMIAEQMRQIDTAPRAIVLEPVGRNTAPAIAVAALMLSRDDPDALMLVLPADHLIGDIAGFHAAIRTAATAARNGYLATFGIVAATPRPATATSRRAPLADSAGVHKVAAFVEKPDLATAQRYVDSGEYFWNSGMFLFHASDFLKELEALRPDILEASRAALGRRHAGPRFRAFGPRGIRGLPVGFGRLCGDGTHPPRCGGAGRHRVERHRCLVGIVGSGQEGRAGQRHPRRRHAGKRPQQFCPCRNPHGRAARRVGPGRGGNRRRGAGGEKTRCRT